MCHSDELPVLQLAYQQIVGVWNNNKYSRSKDSAKQVVEEKLPAASKVPIPENYSEAINSKFAPYWHEAMSEEMKFFHENNVYESVEHEE